MQTQHLHFRLVSYFAKLTAVPSGLILNVGLAQPPFLRQFACGFGTTRYVGTTGQKAPTKQPGAACDFRHVATMQGHLRWLLGGFDSPRDGCLTTWA